MPESPGSNARSDTSSTGQAFTGSAWLDAHFETNRPEYEAMLRSVAIEGSWHVLDVGCGSGSFLPLLSELVGPSGRITAIDVASDNIARVQQRLSTERPTCPISTEVGTATRLPFPADHFDGIWCANTVQYLSEEELDTALREFQRVVRSGGLVALKDSDGLIRIEPTPPFFMQRFADARRRATERFGVQPLGAYRGPWLRAWLRETRFERVWARSTLIERWAPLSHVEQEFWRDALRSMAQQALELDLPATDVDLWRELSDVDKSAQFVAQPDFYSREINIVATGRVP